MKPICRRQFLADHKVEYDESLKVGEDFVLLAEILFNGAKFILIDEAYYIYSMPSGPSGRSPHSRTVYNVGKLPDACDMSSRKYGDRIDVKLKRAMDNYRKTMTLLYESDFARTFHRSGQYGRYLTYLVARPELTRRLFFRTAIKTGKLLRQAVAR